MKLKKFSGKPAEFPNFKADIISHLVSRQQADFLERDIYERGVQPSAQLIAEDVDVQLFIAGNCVRSVKELIQNKARSAKHMMDLLDAQYD